MFRITVFWAKENLAARSFAAHRREMMMLARRRAIRQVYDIGSRHWWTLLLACLLSALGVMAKDITLVKGEAPRMVEMAVQGGQVVTVSGAVHCCGLTKPIVNAVKFQVRFSDLQTIHSLSVSFLLRVLSLYMSYNHIIP